MNWFTGGRPFTEEKNTDWNTIYTIQDTPDCEQKYQAALEYNRRLYDAISPDQYRTIAACVEHAITTGHHGAFAHYFLERAVPERELFQKKFLEYVRAVFGEDLRSFRQCLVMIPLFWEAFDFELSDWQMTDRSFFYTAANLGNFIQEENNQIPQRECLLQLAFYLRLRSTQLNELLQLGGHDGLYPGNPMDAVCQYVLDTDNQDALETVGKHLISPALVHAKKLLNSIYSGKEFAGRMIAIPEEKSCLVANKSMLSKEEQSLLEEMGVQYSRQRGEDRIVNLTAPDSEQLDALHLVWEADSKKLKRIYICHTQVFPDKLVTYKNGAWSIKEEYEQMMRTVKEISRKKADAAVFTVYLTKYMQGILVSEGPEGYLSEWGTKKRNGYLYLLFQFLESEQFRKNLYISHFPLTTETRLQPKYIDDDMQLSYEHPGECGQNRKIPIAGNLEKFAKSTKGKAEKRTVGLLDAVWNLRNGIDVDVTAEVRGMKAMTVLSNSLVGRLITDSEKQEKQAQSGAVSARKKYQFDIGDKQRCVQLAFACGQEDRVGELLKRGGFWNQDLYQRYIPDDEEEIEQLNSLVIYLLLYRDRLIDHWTETYRSSVGTSAVMASELRERLRREFPMIRLAATVSRDIQFVLEEFHVPRKSFLLAEDRWKYSCSYLKKLVYRVSQSEYRWFRSHREKYNEKGSLIGNPKKANRKGGV